MILGPTASGKSSLAIKLAQATSGEVISADSRQVYKGLDIGSGKITKREMKGVPHHLLDITSPKKVFNAAQFQKLGQDKVEEIIKRGKVPIVCGGTGFYIQALVDSLVFPDVPPNKKLREQLERKSTQELATLLKKLDLRRYKTIDINNRPRLIRAIEIAQALGKVPKVTKADSPFETLFIGVNPKEAELEKKIHERLHARLRKGMIREVEHLRSSGISWKRLESFGLEYREIARFLQSKISKKDMIAQLENEINQFSKRQMTWFKRDERIRWFHPKDWAKIKKT
ncbi:MAG TPA: tRNA (adenosine(37)-N6)-dimethylallyltransferase MiaA, partial [Candidatus Nanoarchaeia archaeon]|nr:tRNA (adenosine(37)-N6)-dimethylallyltransferase MiaA [Candidatus Nanoarchaeia archaeon]